MKWSIPAAIAIAALAVFTAINTPNNAHANDHTEAFGQCFTLYECQGGSMGSFDELQCRAMGGHSMLSGGICIEL